MGQDIGNCFDVKTVDFLKLAIEVFGVKITDRRLAVKPGPIALRRSLNLVHNLALGIIIVPE
jgi:hypothetical protein